MIKSWKDEDLQELFETGQSRKIDQKLQKRCMARLDTLNRTSDIRVIYQMHSYELHKYPNFTDVWSISVNGPWRILFSWRNGDAYDVRLVQPHG